MVTKLDSGTATDARPDSYDRSTRSELQMMLEKLGRVREFAPRERLRPETGANQTLYLIESGAITLSHIAANGEELIVGLFFEGDMIGLEGPGESTGAYLAAAFEFARVRVVPLARLREICRRDPLLYGQILRLASRRIAQLRRHMLVVARNGALGRVAGFLSELADRRMEPDGSLRLPLSRNDIGAYLCLSLETVSRSLCRLERDGVIRKRGRFLKVLDGNRLTALAGHTGRDGEQWRQRAGAGRQMAKPEDRKDELPPPAWRGGNPGATLQA
jgi:CRP/FNR family transcriptional regulator